METFYTILAIALALVLAFSLTHLGPLTDDQVGEVAANRRKRRIRRYFVFSGAEFSVSPEFKRSMAAGGRFYGGERGRHFECFRSASDSFFPVAPGGG